MAKKDVEQASEAVDDLATVTLAYRNLVAIRDWHRAVSVRSGTGHHASRAITGSAHLRVAIEALGFLVNEFGGDLTQVK